MAPPIKKFCGMQDMRVNECRREFLLPVQYPSMAKNIRRMENMIPKNKSILLSALTQKSRPKISIVTERPTEPSVTSKSRTMAPMTSKTMTMATITSKAVTVTSNVLSNSAVMSVAPKTVQLVSNADPKGIGLLRKLKIKSHDGKDLGEINVQLLSQKNLVSGKNTLASKGNHFKNLNNPVMLTLQPSQSTGPIVNISPVLDKSLVAPPKPVSSQETNTINNAECNENQLTQNVISTENESILDMPKSEEIDTEKIDSDIKNNILKRKIPLNHENNHTEHNNQSITTLKCIKLPNDKNVMVKNTQNNEEVMVEQKKIEKSNKEPNENSLETGIKQLFDVKNFPLKLEEQHLQLAKSKFPVVKCEKLKLPINEIAKIAGKNQTEKPQTEKSQTEKSKNSVSDSSSSQPRNRSVKNPNQTRFKSNKQNQSKSTAIKKADFLTQSNQQNKVKFAQNVMVVGNEKELRDIPKNIRDNGAEIPNDIVNTFEQEKLSDHWSIITKAVSSVKDSELRAKALKALEDCGIGLERLVPITPPEALKPVHNSGMQTEVFGLLKPNNFVLVRKDQPTLEKIQQTEHVLNTNSSVSNMNTCIKTNNLIDNSNLFVGPNYLFSGDDIELRFLDEQLSENPGANRIKEVMTEPHPKHKRICNQLEKDFEEAKQSDSNGMLNIHRAVINNNLFDLQRLLIVFEACKKSIDVPTEDGMTSLELAIKANSSVDIVRCLLVAGARPVLEKLVHDSALILASKMSSPLLPELLPYITHKKLLDQVDSKGFAALHYCALYGNSEGLDALIKRGADVNLRDSRSGRTSFFHALENNKMTIAHKLLDNGAVANLTNFAGQSALSLVEDIKNLSLRSALRKLVE